MLQAVRHRYLREVKAIYVQRWKHGLLMDDNYLTLTEEIDESLD